MIPALAIKFEGATVAWAEDPCESLFLKLCACISHLTAHWSYLAARKLKAVYRDYLLEPGLLLPSEVTFFEAAKACLDEVTLVMAVENAIRSKADRGSITRERGRSQKWFLQYRLRPGQFRLYKVTGYGITSIMNRTKPFTTPQVTALWDTIKREIRQAREAHRLSKRK